MYMRVYLVLILFRTTFQTFSTINRLEYDETLKIDVTIKALFTAPAAYLFFYFMKNAFLSKIFLVQLRTFVSASLLIVLYTFLNLSFFFLIQKSFKSTTVSVA